jgi:hypothetical protein
MLRIELQNTDSETTVRATGRLAGPWVAELERSLADLGASTLRGAMSPNAMVVLDLTEVSFVDRDGIEFLRRLRRLELVNLICSAFVTEQITDVVSAIGRTDS